MSEHPRCETCAHWVEADTMASPPDWRMCALAADFFRKTEWFGGQWSGGVLALKPEHASLTAGAVDGSDYRADLVTAPKHYCSMHSTLSNA